MYTVHRHRKRHLEWSTDTDHLSPVCNVVLCSILVGLYLVFETPLKLSLVLEVDALDMADQPTIGS